MQSKNTKQFFAKKISSKTKKKHSDFQREKHGDSHSRRFFANSGLKPVSNHFSVYRAGFSDFKMKMVQNRPRNATVIFLSPL